MRDESSTVITSDEVLNKKFAAINAGLSGGTHGKGTYPLVAVYDLTTGNLVEVTPDRVRISTSGDVTVDLEVATASDRYAGEVVISERV